MPPIQDSTYQVEAELQRPKRSDGDEQDEVRADVVQKLPEAVSCHGGSCHDTIDNIE